MLTELYIQDIVLIDRLRLTVSGGLTALTGETGAGKSILLDSLDLATGGRAEKGLVRQGAKQGVVSATFEAPAQSAVWDVLEENGLHTEETDGLIILRRVQGNDGRARAFINDHPVSVTLLRRVGEALIEVHGQHQGQGFLHVAAHRGLLDDFAGSDSILKKVSAAYTAWKDAETALEDYKQDRDQAIREADYLRHVVQELEALGPQVNEESTLAERRATLMAAEKVSSDLTDALSILGDEGMENRLSSALGRIEMAATRLDDVASAPLDALVTRIDAALSEINEARSAVVTAVDSFQFDADELERVEERLFALRAAARKYNTTPDKLGAFFDQARTSLDLIEENEAGLAGLEKSAQKTRVHYFTEAAKLSATRVKAGKFLSKAVAKELTPLKLSAATFSVEIDTDENHANATGIDRVSFLVSTNPGAPLGALKQIASGGELSRFVLAMKAALVAKDNKTVIIFDEVDAGVGGAVADAVGERLGRLAEDAQVLVVTHSPQVAARALKHWQVSKSGKTKTVTSVVPLSQEERVEEIARMISGAEVTKEARAAAEKLIKSGAAKFSKTQKVSAKKTTKKSVKKSAA